MIDKAQTNMAFKGIEATLDSNEDTVNEATVMFGKLQKTLNLY